MKRCACGSYAINIEKGELEDANCDVCHYKNKVIQVAAEAYQVIGALSSDLFHSKEVIRALDYFSAVSCGENPSGEMLPFLCDWEQEPKKEQLKDRLWDKFQSLLNDDDPAKQQSPAGAVSDIYKRVIFEQPDEEKQLTIGVDDSDCPYFILGVQKFRLDPTVIENREHAKWYQKQLAIAFEKFTEGASINPSPRITEQDVREIATDFDSWNCGQNYLSSYSEWYEKEGRGLLNKLNTKSGG